jgi:hypothetical protein
MLKLEKMEQRAKKYEERSEQKRLLKESQVK